MKAERETADRLIAHFLADRIGASFQGRISGVTRAGLFVKLADTGADGLIPIRTLGTEYFNYDEARHALIGQRSGAMHRLGDVVDVRLVEAAPVAGALRFELLSAGSVASRGQRRSQPSQTKAGPGRSRAPKGALEQVPFGEGMTKTKQRKEARKAKAKAAKPGRAKPGKAARQAAKAAKGASTKG